MVIAESPSSVGRHIYAVSKQVQGYKQAMEAAGLEASVHVQASDASYARATTLQLLSELRPPTAIFALNSVVLLGVMQGASEKQLAIPHDLAVAGFEDFEWASFVKPRLTLVRHPGEQMENWLRNPSLIGYPDRGPEVPVVSWSMLN